MRPCLGAASVTNTCPVRQGIDPEGCRFWFVPGVSTLACWPTSLPIRPILGLMWTSTSSCQTAVSSSGNPSRSVRNLANLALQAHSAVTVSP
ncbi:MAG: hypothetical protein JO329_15395, partial [Planctomycetaceae bacterium]|nr:hypothetical protein [Planctomycetaceae bacterium]